MMICWGRLICAAGVPIGLLAALAGCGRAPEPREQSEPSAAVAAAPTSASLAQRTDVTSTSIAAMESAARVSSAPLETGRPDGDTSFVIAMEIGTEADAPPSELTPAERDAMAKERERLTDQLRELDKQARSLADTSLPPPVDDPPPITPPSGAENVRGKQYAGTLRDLDLAGWPEETVTRVISRYGMRITRGVVAGSGGQNFLSGATGTAGERFTATSNHGRPEIANVFLLSARSIAHMSKLEQDEIRRRGLDPQKALVKKVVFGIVGRSPSQADLGVLTMDVEAIGEK